MLDDFQRFLAAISFDDIWKITLEADPNFPVARAKAAWRDRETHINGSEETWRERMLNVASRICSKSSVQIAWPLENLKKFRWMELIHPSKFNENVKKPSSEIRELIREFMDLDPFAVNDIPSVEHNLEVLYSNHEISLSTVLRDQECNRKEKNILFSYKLSTVFLEQLQNNQHLTKV